MHLSDIIPEILVLPQLVSGETSPVDLSVAQGQARVLGLSSAESWMVFFTGMLAVLTLVLAFAAIRQARIARNQSLTTLLLGFLDVYSGKEMMESLAELRKYKEQNAEQLNLLRHLYKCTYKDMKISEDIKNAAETYVSEHEHTVGGAGISEHRARVAWFYSKAWRLDKYGFLTKDVLKTLFSLDGTGAFLEIVVPLTLAIRYVKIHKLNDKSFRIDPNVQWYRDIEKVFEKERPDLKERY